MQRCCSVSISSKCVSAVYDEEMLVVQLQNDLAKLEVDILHTQGHNVRLEQAMHLLNEDINEKMQTIGKYEVCCPFWRLDCLVFTHAKHQL